MNAIPFEAWMEVDMRFVSDVKELAKQMNDKFKRLWIEAVAEENKRWNDRETGLQRFSRIAGICVAGWVRRRGKRHPSSKLLSPWSIGCLS